jgi:hypothetical protein
VVLCPTADHGLSPLKKVEWRAKGYQMNAIVGVMVKVV